MISSGKLRYQKPKKKTKKNKPKKKKRSEKIAEARIHVEQVIQRIKCCHVLDRELRLTMASLADPIFTVCAYLVNFQTPFLR